MAETTTLTERDFEAIGQRLAFYVMSLGLPEEQERALAKRIMDMSPAEGLFVLENIETLIAHQLAGGTEELERKVDEILAERNRALAVLDEETAAALEAVAEEYQLN